MNLIESTIEQYNQYNNIHSKAMEGIDLSEFINPRPDAYIENGIGHVYVTGMLLKNTAPIDKKLGNTSYQSIIEELDQLVSQGATGIILHCSSGGGTCNGAIEAAQAVQTCSVPVVAMVESVCASACYKLACASSWVVSSPSAISGSIGTILVIADQSAMYSNMGISFNVFTGEGNTLKSIGQPQTLSEEQLAFLTESINEASTNFKNWVIENRPNVSDEVFRSGFYTGNKAVELGLVDELGDYKLAQQRLMQLLEFIDPVD